MKEKWDVRNNTKTILFLPQNKIKLNPENSIDLVEFTGKRVIDLENDKEIKRELSYNNLITIQKIKDEPQPIVSAAPNMQPIEDKLNKILGMLSEQDKASLESGKINLDSLEEILKEKLKNITITPKEKDEEIAKKEDEKMREKAIEVMIEKEKQKEDNLKAFGQSTKIEDAEDHSDFIEL